MQLSPAAHQNLTIFDNTKSQSDQFVRDSSSASLDYLTTLTNMQHQSKLVDFTPINLPVASGQNSNTMSGELLNAYGGLDSHMSRTSIKKPKPRYKNTAGARTTHVFQTENTKTNRR